MKAVDSLMSRAISENVFPGGGLLVSHAGEILFNEAYGLANIFSSASVTPNTLFDLASLTKPLATTLAVMLLVQEGRIALDQRLVKTLPEFRSTQKQDIQIWHLLRHTSGLPPYRPYYLDLCQIPVAIRKDELRKKLIGERLADKIGLHTVYSDIGFMILEWVLERLSGKPLNDFVKEKIYARLGIKDLFFICHEQLIPQRNYAATENCPWRGMLLNGQVHDDNAWVMGGVAGHAGLFGTAEAVNAVLTELMKAFHGVPETDIFHPHWVRTFFHKSPHCERVLGFDTPSATGSSCGKWFSRNSTVGHLGFTGTSFWMDLQQEVIIVLLTNRVHPSRENAQIKKFRPEIHDAVMQQLHRQGILKK